MPYLLDTHLLLWSLYLPARLPSSFISRLEFTETEAYFSVVSFIEIAIKLKLGKLEFSVDLDAMRSSLLSNDFIELPLEIRHTIALADLPLLHRDPFDRLLVAQAKSSGCVLLTVDERLRDYGGMVEVIR